MPTITAQEVRSTVFTTLVRGYSLDEVDEFLDLLADALDDLEEGRWPRLTSSDVGRQTFSTSLRGYSMDEVDALLDDAVATLEGRSDHEEYERAHARPVPENALHSDHPIPVAKGRPGWFWTGVVLLTVGCLSWLVIIAALIDDPTEIGGTLLETAVVTVIPIAFGTWAFLRGRRLEARRAHTTPSSWSRLGRALVGLGLMLILSAAVGMEVGDYEVGTAVAVVGVLIWIVAGLVRAWRAQRGQPTAPILVFDARLTFYEAGLVGVSASLENTSSETLFDLELKPFRYRRTSVVLSTTRPIAGVLLPGEVISHETTEGPVEDVEAWRRAIEANTWGLLTRFSDGSDRQWEQLLYP